MAEENTEKPLWRGAFAIVVAAAIALLTGVLLVWSGILEHDLGLEDAYESFDSRQVLGARIVGVVAAVGIVVVAMGLWMALVEWRGRFEAAQEAKKALEAAAGDKVTGLGAEDAAKLIPETVEALGALKGAALVLVSGVVILLGVSWMTASATGAPPASTTTTTAPS